MLMADFQTVDEIQCVCLSRIQFVLDLVSLDLISRQQRGLTIVTIKFD